MHVLFLTNVLAGKVIQAFCWMLIHSLWQGLLFIIITGVVMMLTARSGAALRYNIVSVLFFLFITVCGFTFIRELNYTVDHISMLHYANPVDINESSLQYFFKRFINYASSHASLIVMLWFIIFCLKAVKMATALIYNNQVKNHKIQIASACWKNKITDLCKKLQIKRTVLLFESEIVKIPVVMGHFKPLIFIPVGLLTSLPAEEVEAVLLHELVHIRRNDYVVNMVQVIAESIFFFNPALLWMSDMLREERENCCDDIAVAHSKSKKQFIQALISFKEHALYTSSYKTAFLAGKNQLLRRVSRIINNRNNTLDTVGKIFFMASILLLALLSVAATNDRTMLPAQKTVKKEAPAVKPMPAERVPLAQTKILVDNIKHVVINKKSAGKPDNAKAHYYLTISSANAKYKTLVIKIDKKPVIEDDNLASATNEGQIDEDEASNPSYDQQAELYRQMAEKDREQAFKNRKQAELNRIQSQKDREQAVKDMKQAALDRKHAEKDRQQAEKEIKLNIQEKSF